AKNTSVAFKAAGTYSFLVTLADPSGLTATSSGTVTVLQTLTGLSVSPATVTLAQGATKQFQAVQSDQFGNAMSAPVACTWSVIGIGSIGSSGLYTAPNSDGSATVQATTGGLSGNAAVSVSSLPAAPVLFAAAVTSHQVNLSWTESSTNVTGFTI